MLESIEIQNFRSCDDVRLRLGEPVVALLGKNGAGKTNVLHAIQLAAELCVGESDPLFRLSPRDRKKPTTFVLKFFVGGRFYHYRVSRQSPAEGDSLFAESLEREDEVLFKRTAEQLDSYIASFPSGLRIPTPVSSLFVLMQILSPQHPLRDSLRTVAEYLRAVRYYPLPQRFQEHAEHSSIPFVDAARYEKWKAGFAVGRPSESVLNRLVHMYLTNREKLDELSRLVGEDGLGLISEIRIEEITTRGLNPEVAPEPAYSILFVPCSGIAGAGRPFSYSGLSAGTWRVIRLLTYLVFDESSCMLVEQPEDCIHAGLLGKLIDILHAYADRTQLICTTHSPRVMNLVGAEGIRIVAATNGKTEVLELSPKEIEASQSYLADEGTLAEFLETL